MKTITTSKGTFTFILVPYDAYDFKIVGNNILFMQPKEYYGKIRTEKHLLAEIITTTKEITEEVAQGIVEKYHDGSFRDYVADKLGSNWRPDISINDICISAKESLNSLLEANEMNTENNYLILKQTK